MSRYTLPPLSRIVPAPPGTSASRPADTPHANPPPPEREEDKQALAAQILAAGARARTPTGTPEAAAEDDEAPLAERFAMPAGQLGPKPTLAGWTDDQKKELAEKIVAAGRRRRGEVA